MRRVSQETRGEVKEFLEEVRETLQIRQHANMWVSPMTCLTNGVINDNVKRLNFIKTETELNDFIGDSDVTECMEYNQTSG